MARNEEKQLARLNRWYLQKQREEEAIKRPPRPKLNSLTTAEEVKKWIPTITRDIDFYVKQMAVPCYPEHVITDFNGRIDHLKGEYKAFLRKLRELCPEEKSTPWSDRPYSPKRKKMMADEQSTQERCSSNRSENSTCKESIDLFIPLRTPVLDNHVEYSRFYGSLKSIASPNPCDLNVEHQNQPLDFLPNLETSQKSQCDLNDEHQNQPLDFLPIQKPNQKSEDSPSQCDLIEHQSQPLDFSSIPKTIQRSKHKESITTSVVSKSNESSVMYSNRKFTDESNMAQNKSQPQKFVVSSSSVITPKDLSCFNVKEKNSTNNNTLARSNTITPQPSMPSLNLPYTDSSSDEPD